jgi:uncharacterized radical SAM superfamily Fe-S cluster-containing enzyme
LDRNYIFHESTQSLCNECLKLISAKIIFEDNKVYILKYCPEHGEQKELYEDNIDYYLKKREYDKPGTKSAITIPRNKGCPYDCGLCEEHDQHTCIGLIEINQNCNLDCEMCFAKESEPNNISLEKAEEIMNFYQRSENNNAEILQISGGEPTLHPQVLEIIALAKEKKFKHIMLNTNGLRIAEDEEFIKELSKFKGGFEIYLQFDSFLDDNHKKLRGRNLKEVKEKAIENLCKYEIPITLVSTIEKEVNDKEIGDIIFYGINKKYIRGINFQPRAYYEKENICRKDRITLSGIIDEIDRQTRQMIKVEDFIPLPCNVERVGLTYLIRKNGEFLPIADKLEIKSSIKYVPNTLAFHIEDFKEAKGISLGSTCNCFKIVKNLERFVPKTFFLKSKKEQVSFIDENIFRITITSFVDKYNFDMKSVQKECVHILTEELKKMPFSTYNIIHRKRMSNV